MKATVVALAVDAFVTSSSPRFQGKAMKVDLGPRWPGPRWGPHVQTVAHPSTSGTAYTALYTQVIRLGGEAPAMDYVQQLNTNIAQYTKSGSAPAPIAGRGEIAASIVFSHDCVKNIADFPDLVVGFPIEGTGYEIGGVALIANAPEKRAAQMWMDWSLTSRVQEIGATVVAYQLPTNPDAAISDKSVKVSDVKLVEYDFDAAGAARTELTKRFEDEVAPKPADEATCRLPTAFAFRPGSDSRIAGWDS